MKTTATTVTNATAVVLVTATAVLCCDKATAITLTASTVPVAGSPYVWTATSDDGAREAAEHNAWLASVDEEDDPDVAPGEFTPVRWVPGVGFVTET